MSTPNPAVSTLQNRLVLLRKEAAGLWCRIMRKYDTVILTLAAGAVTVLVVLLLWLLPRYQQEYSTETPTAQTSVTMLNPGRLSKEQQRKLQWILKTQDPALLLRGDHKHSYTALWKKQKFPSAVTAPETETPEFAKPASPELVPLKTAAPEKDRLREFVPRPVAPPAVVKNALPRAFDEKSRAVLQLRIEPVNKPVTAPTRLTLRKQGPLTLPQVLESCGVPDLDELAKQQVVSAMPRLGEIREITIYWNSKEELP